MSAAAQAVPVDRISDWLEELERIMQAFDTLPSAAQDAVNSVIESLARDTNTSDAEIAHLNALLALHKSSLDDGRQQRPTSRSQKRSYYADRIALSLSQSS